MTCHGFFYASRKAYRALLIGTGHRPDPRIIRRYQGLVRHPQELQVPARQRLAQPFQRRVDLTSVGQHRRIAELPAKITGLG